jgi:tRNA G18 (ribose-2'-O)-methylase SpoU
MALEKHIDMNVRETRDLFIEQNNSGYNVHDHLKGLSVAELKAITQNNVFPFWVCCLNVLSDMNISTVIRSAHLMGAERAVVFGRRKIDNRGLVGAAHYTHVDKVWGVDCNAELNADLFEGFCHTHKVIPIFVEQGGQNVYNFDWNSHIMRIETQGYKPMLTLGTENSGIPQSILDRAPRLKAETVSIPQSGVIRSHNVSMAYAISASQMVAQMGWY